MRKPQNVDDYLELVDQAMFEIGDLIASVEFESEGDLTYSTFLPVLHQIDAGLKALWEEIKSGNYVIGRGEDLPFMLLVAKHREQIPIARLLDTVNLAHKNGYNA